MLRNTTKCFAKIECGCLIELDNTVRSDCDFLNPYKDIFDFTKFV